MKTDAKLTPVREAHRFDENALDEYLKNNLEWYAGSLKVQQFEGGQSNPTFLLTAGGTEYVMRKKPPGKLLPSAHQVEREFRVMKALERSDVPVPRMDLLCEDENIIGTPFFVMEHVQSRVLEDISLPDMAPEERRALYFDLIRVLAERHMRDVIKP